MVYLDFSAKASGCDKLIFKDETPDHSPENLGGYGGYNVLKGDIKWARLTFFFGGAKKGVSISKKFNPEEDTWEVYSTDLVIPEELGTSGCQDCSPCIETTNDCSHCSDSPIDLDCERRLNAFPEGCIKVQYEVFDKGDPCDLCKNIPAVGIRVKNIINVCSIESEFAEIVNKLTSPSATRCYDFNDTQEKRQQSLQTIAFAWAKLNLALKSSDNVDCDCLSGQLKIIRETLKVIKL